MLRECGLCTNEDQTASEVDEITACANMKAKNMGTIASTMRSSTRDVLKQTQQENVRPVGTRLPSERKANARKTTGERGIGREDELVPTRDSDAPLLFDIELLHNCKV